MQPGRVTIFQTALYKTLGLPWTEFTVGKMMVMIVEVVAFVALLSSEQFVKTVAPITNLPLRLLSVSQAANQPTDQAKVFFIANCCIFLPLLFLNIIREVETAFSSQDLGRFPYTFKFVRREMTIKNRAGDYAMSHAERVTVLNGCLENIPRYFYFPEGETIAGEPTFEIEECPPGKKTEHHDPIVAPREASENRY